MSSTPGHFHFGRNWEAYSERFLDEERLAEAQRSLDDLVGAGRIGGRRFLDVGCGAGIFSIAAARLGAREIVGIDVDPRCVEIARRNAERFADTRPRFEVASILDGPTLDGLGTFDVVYAWGSLHHTGDMRRAIESAAKLTARGGLLALAIYNRHFTSPAWRVVKKLYNALPGVLRPAMAWLFIPPIFCAKLLVTRRNPLRKRRGMSFAVDVVDWIGGWPYEYASRAEIETLVGGMGFSLEKFVAAPVPTGCNEYVFARQR